MRHRLIGTRQLGWKILAAALLIAAFAGRDVGAAGALWDIACIGAVMPLVIILGLNGADHPRFDRVLGEASYPLYAIHFPLLSLFSGLHQELPQVGAGALFAATIVSLAAATFMATRLYDRPLRRWLTSRLSNRTHLRSHRSGPDLPFHVGLGRAPARRRAPTLSGFRASPDI